MAFVTWETHRYKSVGLFQTTFLSKWTVLPLNLEKNWCETRALLGPHTVSNKAIERKQGSTACKIQFLVETWAGFHGPHLKFCTVTIMGPVHFNVSLNPPFRTGYRHIQPVSKHSIFTYTFTEPVLSRRGSGAECTCQRLQFSTVAGRVNDLQVCTS